ncbi:tetraacyldisaccharide 4'-kinase [Thraustotheca clavata]|uniref:tetraacyldisaccharide 4'-kinase n=1 Tax=Thraustotheca clavata TaxID=74557 RepID=A0A1W0ABJ1_9STRA|nr:tetraacyldisaccharide 4'-kinase [Thraustotheca clavata]
MLETWRRTVWRLLWHELMKERSKQHPVAQSTLSIATRLYEAISTHRRHYYMKKPRQKLPIPTISFGNVTWGGTGKTPCLHYVARYLIAKNVRLMLVSRGYGDDEWKVFAVEFPNSLLALGKNRFENAMKELKSHGMPTNVVALVDDGLQQYTLHKDLEIVMVDAYNPFGNGSLLPRGRLREYPDIALPRADIVILHHADHLTQEASDALQSSIRLHIKPATIIATTHMALTSLPLARELLTNGSIRGLKVEPFPKPQVIVGFCGIGCPGSFKNVLQTTFPDAEVYVEFFPDHYDYTSSDMDYVKSKLRQKYENKNVVIITTEKDFFRSKEVLCRSWDRYDFRVAMCEIEFTQERDAVIERIESLLE